MNTIIQFLGGKKTYIIGLSAIVYGFYSHNNDMIVIGLGLMGLRQGITTEAKKVLDSVNPVV
jgi:hypothetical protein